MKNDWVFDSRGIRQMVHASMTIFLVAFGNNSEEIAADHTEDQIMKKIKLTALFLVIVLCLTGCGSSNYSSAESAAAYDSADFGNAKGAVAESFAVNDAAAGDYYEDYEESYDDAAPEDYSESMSESSEKPAENVAAGRKLIKRVSISAETREFDKITNFIEKKVAILGGYMENSNVYSGSSYHNTSLRTATYTARVPVDKMNELVEDVGENANITQKNESAEDVTLNYVDNKSRKEALQVEYDRLMEILKQAEDVDTIVELERRITEVRYDIQNIESTLRTYDNLVDFATVNISITEVDDYTPEPVHQQTRWERLTSGLAESIQDVGEGILDFIIDLIIALPRLAVFALIVFIIFLIIRAIVRKIKRGKTGESKREKKKRLKKEKEEAAAPGNTTAPDMIKLPEYDASSKDAGNNTSGES